MAARYDQSEKRRSSAPFLLSILIIISTKCMICTVEAYLQSEVVLLLPRMSLLPDFLRIGDLNEVLISRATKGATFSKGWAGGRDIYFVTEPSLVREVTVVKAKAFRNRDLCPLSAASGGVVTAQDDRHRAHRHALNPLFLRPEGLRRHHAKIVEETGTMLAQWDAPEQALLPQRATELVEYVNRLAMNVLFQILFSVQHEAYPPGMQSSLSPAVAGGKRVKPLYNSRPKMRALVMDRVIEQVALAFVTLSQLLVYLKPFGSFFGLVKAFTNRKRQVEKQKQRLKASFQRLICIIDISQQVKAKKEEQLFQHNKEKEGKGTIKRAKDRRAGQGAQRWLGHAESLTAARVAHFMKGNNAGNDVLGLTINTFERRFPRAVFEKCGCQAEISALMKDILIAGSDTTAASIVTTLREITANEDIFSEVCLELQTVILDKGNTFPSYEDVENQLPYLSACVNEALRLHTSSPLLFRVANEDTTLGDNQIKKGSGVIMSTEWLGRDPSFWGGQSLEFNPRRHFKEENKMESYYDPSLTDENFDQISMRKKKSQRKQNTEIAHQEEGPVIGHPSPHAFSFLPFGAGNHACLGSKLGFVATVTVVSSILTSILSTENLDGVGQEMQREAKDATTYSKT